jgi:hypothetical protein
LHIIGSLDEIGVYNQGGMILTFGPRSGWHLITDMDFNLNQPDKSKARGFEIVGGKPTFFIGSLMGTSKNRSRF